MNTQLVHKINGKRHVVIADCAVISRAEAIRRIKNHRSFITTMPRDPFETGFITHIEVRLSLGGENLNGSFNSGLESDRFIYKIGKRHVKYKHIIIP